MASRNGQRKPAAIPRIDFHRTKYGPEILIDIAWVHEMPAFIQGHAHALTFHDIILVTGGDGAFWLDGHRHAVKPGAIFFSSPGQVRRWEARGLDGICLFFPAAFLEEFFNDAAFLHRLPYFHASAGAAAMRYAPARARTFRRRLLAMRRELRAQRPDSAHILRARLYEVLVTLARDYAAVHRVPAERDVHPAVLHLLGLVERDFRRRHQVADYAREIGISPGHLRELCRRFTGRSAKGIIRQRIDLEARRLLLFTAESAERVGYVLGFEDPSYFSRFFRSATGQSPTEFRRRPLWRSGNPA